MLGAIGVSTMASLQTPAARHRRWPALLCRSWHRPPDTIVAVGGGDHSIWSFSGLLGAASGKGVFEAGIISVARCRSDFRLGRQTSLLSYMAQFSRFPSWLLYESGRTDWSKVDGGFHSYCFIGQGVDGPPWCGPCQSLDPSCPERSQDSSVGSRRLFSSSFSTSRSDLSSRSWSPPDCPFGDCIYLHVCATDHPESGCPKQRPA